jgi:hypothetical protein
MIPRSRVRTPHNAEEDIRLKRQVYTIASWTRIKTKESVEENFYDRRVKLFRPDFDKPKLEVR